MTGLGLHFRNLTPVQCEEWMGGSYSEGKRTEIKADAVTRETVGRLEKHYRSNLYGWALQHLP